MDNVHLLNSVKNEVLDSYLSYGWYRGGHLIFTTHTLEPHGDSNVYHVFWLRYLVNKVTLSAKNLKLIDKNRQFTVSYRPFSLTPELEELHRKYHESLDFTTAASLPDLLKDTINQVYDSYLVELRDNGQLIAAGVFDRGTETIAGIVNIYDPAYKKYSPGKFLMLMKYQYCVDHKVPYYYPGYYSPQYPVFDYKLFLDENATEVFIPGLCVWIPYKDFVKIAESLTAK